MLRRVIGWLSTVGVVMGDEVTRRAAQARSADRVAEVFTPEPLSPPARSTIREPPTVPEPGVVDLLGSFAQVRRLSLRIQHDLTTGEQVSDEEWTELAEVFAAASRACLERRRATAPDVDDIGDSGGR